MDLNKNEKEIIAVPHWGTAGQVLLSVIRFNGMRHFSFVDQTAAVHWSLHFVNDNGSLSDELAGGLVEIPTSIIAQWSTDDEVIYNYIMQQLNVLEKA